MTTKPTDRPRVPRGRRGAKPKDDTKNQATVDEFDREGLGVAAKE